MYDISYCMWVRPRDLAPQIKKLQDTGAFIQSVVLIEDKKDRVQYSVTYTDLTRDN